MTTLCLDSSAVLTVLLSERRQKTIQNVSWSPLIERQKTIQNVLVP